MSFDVISAQYVNGYKIQITFENGKAGVVDFLKYIEKGRLVFSQKKEQENFLKYRFFD